MSKSGLNVDQLEELCENLSLRLKIMKDKLREVSKLLNITINERYEIKKKEKI